MDVWASYLRLAYSNLVVQIVVSRMINRGCTAMELLTKSPVCLNSGLGNTAHLHVLLLKAEEDRYVRIEKFSADLACSR